MTALICFLVSVGFFAGFVTLLVQILIFRKRNAGPKKSLKIMAFSFLGAAVALLVISYFSWAGEEMRLEKIEANKKKVMAKIVSVKQDNSVVVNHIVPYRIACEWLDTLKGKKYLFESERIFHDPNFELRDIFYLEVDLDSTDYNNYRVNLESAGINP
jgi:hypothetical protein